MSIPVGQAARQGAWQAASRTGRMLHRLVQLVVALLMLATTGAGLLVIRLAQGPLDINWLAQRITENASTADIAVTIRGAALTWEGLHAGADSPLDLVLRGVRVRRASGPDLLVVPRAAVSLDVLPLLHGRVAFHTIVLDRVRLSLQRAADGSLLDMGAPDDANSDTSAGDLVALLQHALTAPPYASTDRSQALWSNLRRVRLRDSAIAVDDRKIGLSWSVPDLQIDLTRAGDGGASGTVGLTLLVGDERTKLDARVALLAKTGGMSVAASMSPTNPAHLAMLAPALAPLMAIDVPVELSGTAALDSRLGLQTASVSGRLDAGMLLIGDGVLPIRAATFTAEATPSSLNLHVQDVRLQVRRDASPTHVRADISATRAAGRLRAKISVDIDQLSFVDLPAFWPIGTGGPGTRPWVTKNITGGIVHNGHADMVVAAAEDFSDLALTSLSGGIDGSDVTTHWLRPVPPIEHGEAHITFVDPDTMDVMVSAGRQAGTRLTLRPSKIRFTGLAKSDQFIAIQSDMGGPFADLAALLKLPAVHLLDRLDVPINNPTGDVSGHLTLNFPLKTTLSFDDVAIHANGKLAHGHIGSIAAGSDVDNAAFDFDVGNAGLKITGPADVAGIASQLQVDMDFRPGPPSGVLQRVSLTGTATPAQVTALGLNVNGVMSGSLGMQLDYLDRRDNSAEVRLSGDLKAAGFDGGRLPWRKKPGTPGTLELHAALKSGHVVGIDRVHVEASGLSLLMSMEMAAGRLDRLKLQRLVLGDSTDVAGEVDLPLHDADPAIITVTGTSIDLSSEFDRHDQTPAEKAARGPAFSLEARLNRVVLSPGRQINDVRAKVENDGLVTKTARLSATAGNGPFTISIMPQQGGRKLVAEAQDAGAMLYAFDLVQSMKGGHLNVDGAYDDSNASHMLRGKAEITDFRVANAPVVVRLLQGISVYGLLDAAQGPGLGITRMEAPFQLGNDVLTLDDAHAASPSLGFTVKGQIDIGHHNVNLEGTVVPAYFFNSLLGKLPLIGRLFSPETGGGLFAAAYFIHGSFDNPDVLVNPLSAITPGFLRGFFGLFNSAPSPK